MESGDKTYTGDNIARMENEQNEGNEAESTSLCNHEQETRRNNRNPNIELRRSNAKELIERYFYQLLRGCGNSECTNVDCFSSGHVPSTMTPNQAAARALQLFGQDAQLCGQSTTTTTTTANLQQSNARLGLPSNVQNSQAPTIIPNNAANSTQTTLNSASTTSTGSSRRASVTSPLTSSSGTTSSSISASASTIASNSSQNSTAANTGIDAFLLDFFFNSNSPNDQRRTTRLYNSGGGGGVIGGSGSGFGLSVGGGDATNKRQQPTTSTSTINKQTPNDDFDSETFSTFTRIHQVTHLNEQIVDTLIEKGNVDGKYELLLSAIKDVYSNVDKLSRSFRRSNNLVLNRLTTSTTATKLQELLGKSAHELKKEDLRSMEGENEKDEDSTCAAQNEMNIEISEGEGVIGGEGETTITTSGSATATLENDDEQMVRNIRQSTVVDDDIASGSSGAATAVAAEVPSTHRTEISTSDDSEDENIFNAKDYANLKGTSDMLVDLESLRRVKTKLFALNKPAIANMLNTSIIRLSDSIQTQRILWDWEEILHCLIICFDMITNSSNSLIDFEFLERSLPRLCKAVRVLPVARQARLTRIWSVHCKDQLHSLVQCCQQLISLNAIIDEARVQENTDVIAATKVLKIAYYASILAGESDPPKNPILNDIKNSENLNSTTTNSLVMQQQHQQDEDSEFFAFNNFDGPRTQYPRYADDDLAKQLNLRAMYCRIPIVPYDEFYNEPLSEHIQMDRDYLCYKKLSLDPRSEETQFSFMLYSFILTPATKVVGLYYDSRIRMYSERHTTLNSLLSLYNGEDSLNSTPELKLKIRRDNIVNDALVGLELAALGNPKNLKKQLVIEFVGEEGIDEGGVSKEFFQLIVDEIFNVDFGMFMEMEETNAFWFNSMSFENDAQFILIGIIIGLAIYNNIILAVRFPMVVYRKLMGAEGSFYDLQDFSPTLYRSLKSIMDYVDDDMEDVFMQTFKISYTNVFGDVVEHELKSNGSEIMVNQTNKQDFIDLYANFLLNESINRQFEAFKRGFEMVTDESPLRLLFRPEEIELLVCGSKKFDFIELEKSTEYEGGFSKDTPIIKYFWEIVHAMPEESKRKLLEFTTGSDRVPVGGLSRLKLLITRQGPDSDRLPTSHTCFNILLLPEYSSKEKLGERLLKAINYSKGFGMI